MIDFADLEAVDICPRRDNLSRLRLLSIHGHIVSNLHILSVKSISLKPLISAICLRISAVFVNISAIYLRTSAVCLTISADCLPFQLFVYIVT